jgi:uncharacterized protein YaaW (UPF0174 family)
MAYNDFIKKELRKKYKGKLGRKVLRNKAAKEIKQHESGLTQSPLGKMRSRQERKKMAKALGVPFTPQYNGPVYLMESELITYKSPKGVLYKKRAYKNIKEL